MAVIPHTVFAEEPSAGPLCTSPSVRGKVLSLGDPHLQLLFSFWRLRVYLFCSEKWHKLLGLVLVLLVELSLIKESCSECRGHEDMRARSTRSHAV